MNYLYAEKLTYRKRALQTQEVADLATFLLSHRSSGINGQGIVIDAGMGLNYFDREVVEPATEIEMKFSVGIEGMAYSLPSEAVSSIQLEQRLAPLYERLNLRPGRLELMTGIKERRFWPADMNPSVASAQAGRNLLKRNRSGRDRPVDSFGRLSGPPRTGNCLLRSRPDGFGWKHSDSWAPQMPASVSSTP